MFCVEVSPDGEVAVSAMRCAGCDDTAGAGADVDALTALPTEAGCWRLPLSTRSHAPTPARSRAAAVTRTLGRRRRLLRLADAVEAGSRGNADDA